MLSLGRVDASPKTDGSIKIIQKENNIVMKVLTATSRSRLRGNKARYELDFFDYTLGLY